MRVGVNTGTAGAKSGTASLTLTSDGTGTSGLAALGLGTQQVAVSGKVYAPAVAQVNTPAVDFGIVRVGDAVARNVEVRNAASGALTDTLRATLGIAAAPFSAGGTASAITAGQVDSNSLQVSLDTRTAGSFAGTAALAFTSQNAEMANLILAGASVSLAAQVNPVATAALRRLDGGGSFTAGLNSYAPCRCVRCTRWRLERLTVGRGGASG